MQEVARIYGLTGFFQGEFPDGGLADLDPRVLERAVDEVIRQVQPQVVMTYDPHGVSAFTDHLITHAVVKRAFVEARDRPDGPRRLAYQVVSSEFSGLYRRRVFSTPRSEMDAILDVRDSLDVKRQALAVQQVIAVVVAADNTDQDLLFQPEEYYVFFQEHFRPARSCLFADLPT
jgi:LmbE family N-acetylglucosaminyl deacetylase